ncbi:hypothetical protein HARCEL1_01410 [Halococcoides cellulosivorans]|uniref:Uncharacterized protein n=2 Tax=Halococcoides cellulosivorans TaxID=1679096 RepID=A0A2R4WY45_9EURY|nr:hypothetical protein HARCEL1_01410 [Halococcoides cellulosivorans]
MVDPLDLFQRDGGSPVEWIGEEMALDHEKDWQNGLVCWDQSQYERIERKLSPDRRPLFIENARPRPRAQLFQDAISVNEALFSSTSVGQGFATTGEIDVDSLVSQQFEDRQLREALMHPSKILDVTVEADDSYRGLDVYRQRFVKPGPTRAIALNESMVVVSNLLDDPAAAVESVKSLVDTRLDSSKRMTKTNDDFGRFISLLDPGFVSEISFHNSNMFFGSTAGFDGDAGVIREVSFDPERIRADCTDEVEQFIDEVIDRYEQRGTDFFDPITDINVETSDGVGVIELSAPLHELQDLFWSANFIDRGAFSVC